MMIIESHNTRRFTNQEGEVLAIYDTARNFTTYGTVTLLADGRDAFGKVRAYFPDEIEEL
jgi:hypothetical protein